MSRAKEYTQGAPIPKATKACYLAPELEAVQHLMIMSPGDYRRLLVSVKASGVRDSLKGYQTEDGFAVLSGAHRLRAARFAKIATVPVETLNLSPAQREQYALDENLSRRHMTTQQRKGLALHLIKKRPTASSRAIAREVGIDHKTVENLRTVAAARGEIPHAPRKDSRGRAVGEKPKQELREAQKLIESRKRSNPPAFSEKEFKVGIKNLLGPVPKAKAIKAAAILRAAADALDPPKPKTAKKQGKLRPK